MDRTGEFYALLFRSKNINRWGMMRNMFPENLSSHSWETAVLTHALALIGNRELSKSYDVERLVLFALYHDVSEILTGDLPTPVKYYNEDIKNAYKKIEQKAEERILSLLRDDFRSDFEKLSALTPEEHKIVKSADKLCAYIKCLDELSASNREFVAAEKSIRESLDNSDCEEARYFIEHYLKAFEKPLDDITI
ncbi:MAG: 5'-deoxynucleotidase [Clostridia bacterium]|nr:5'-deoxynucleotidase [Clostridia bacterium]